MTHPIRLDGVRTRAQSEIDRQAAADRRDTMLMVILVTLTIVTAIALGALAQALWTMRIDTLLNTPRVIY